MKYWKIAIAGLTLAGIAALVNTSTRSVEANTEQSIELVSQYVAAPPQRSQDRRLVRRQLQRRQDRARFHEPRWRQQRLLDHGQREGALRRHLFPW